jgi:hypothetical protein
MARFCDTARTSQTQSRALHEQLQRREDEQAEKNR